MAKLLTIKEKIGIKEFHIKEDGTKCVYCENELDLETCVIAHLDNNTKNNNDWNHALAHQKCNIDAIENTDYRIKAQETIKLNHSKIYAPRVEDRNEHVSTEVEINTLLHSSTQKTVMKNLA